MDGNILAQGGLNDNGGQGVSLSADGNTLVEGGLQDNTNQGAVWIFTRSGTTWTQQAKLGGTGNINCYFCLNLYYEI